MTTHFPLHVQRQLAYGAPSHAEIQARKERQRISFGAYDVVKAARLAFESRTRASLSWGYFLFNAFADYSEGWDSVAKDRLWLLCVAARCP